SGTQVPISPSSPSFVNRSRGKRCSRSHAAALGAISASATSRARTWISRCSALRAKSIVAQSTQAPVGEAGGCAPGVRHRILSRARCDEFVPIREQLELGLKEGFECRDRIPVWPGEPLQDLLPAQEWRCRNPSDHGGVTRPLGVPHRRACSGGHGISKHVPNGPEELIL